MPFKVLDNRNDTDLEKGHFATLKAIKGKQFGREIFSTVIKFKDLSDFLEIFPDVQRDIIPRKVSSLKTYILTGLEKEDKALRFFSAVTVSCRGHMFYDETNNRLAIDINESKLSVNDGQHRIKAVEKTLEYLESELVKSKDKYKTERIRRWIDELSEMVIPMVIFNGLDDVEESQLFHDLNNLAQRPSRNTNIKLNQTDLYSKMARELAEENRYLKHYGVEYEKGSIQKNNPNTILLTTVFTSIKELLNYEYKSNKSFLTNENYEMYKKDVNDTFDKLFFVLPPDLDTKNKYILDKSYGIKAISKFICDARNHLDLQMKDEDIFEIIRNIDWTPNVEYWSEYGGMLSESGVLVFGGGTNGGFRAVYRKLMDKATNNEGYKIVKRQGLVIDHQISS